ncbi:MAG: hypothetical protein NUW09_01320, partial [Deltaproteobacteria bacterium]|nr:hypothetical protein [Deltaproteobacteria bacterium]
RAAHGVALRSAGYARERAYQQRATWGLQNMNPQGTNPSTYLGTQADDTEALPPLPPTQPYANGLTGPVAAPGQATEAYAAPLSGGARQQVSGGAYRPQQFANPLLDRRQKELDAYYARLAKGWR